MVGRGAIADQTTLQEYEYERSHELVKLRVLFPIECGITSAFQLTRTVLAALEYFLASVLTTGGSTTRAEYSCLIIRPVLACPRTKEKWHHFRAVIGVINTVCNLE